MNFSGTTAKASLTSNRSIWSSDMPALASTLRAAGTGALSMSVGSSPMLAAATIRARGVSPCERAYSGLVISRAAAPSTTPDELPAWWTCSISRSGYFWAIILRKVSPSAFSSMSAIPPKLGCSSASLSAVVPGRGYSSRSSRRLPSGS